MNMKNYKCSVCKKELDADEAYEYRGAISCEKHHGRMIENRDYERSEIMVEENHKLKPLEGLSFGDSVVGRANREIMKPQLEITRKESGRIRAYEGRK